MSTDAVGAVSSVHGGVKFYKGAAKAARDYVERDRSRADDYYLGEGTGVAARLMATPDGIAEAGSLDGDTYEQWVAGIDIDTGRRKVRSARTRTPCGSSRSPSTAQKPGPQHLDLAEAVRHRH